MTMPQLIIDKAIAESPYRVGTEADLAEPNILLPLAVYLEHRTQLAARNDVGIWLDAGEEAEDIATFASRLPVIALNFPTFHDGRSLSNATILRRRFNYTGEIRAIGDVRRDQLDQMQRCGINAFEMAAGQDLQQALASLSGFTYTYQGSIDRPAPLFRSHRHV